MTINDLTKVLLLAIGLLFFVGVVITGLKTKDIAKFWIFRNKAHGTEDQNNFWHGLHYEQSVKIILGSIGIVAVLILSIFIL